jgi:hypothetical protein
MNFLDPEIQFDPNKPFQRLVVAYAAQVHGLLDLVARGIREEWRRMKVAHGHLGLTDDQFVEMQCAGVKDGYAEHVRAVLKSESGALAGVQRLGTLSGGGVKVDTGKLAQQVFLQHKDPVPAFAVMSAGSLLILAWESTLDKHTKHPLWEFLRHCRNASAHKGGHFHFLHGEPKRPAHWRSLKIEPSLQGTPLFWNSQHSGFIGPGDALYLLADIEKQFY